MLLSVLYVICVKYIEAFQEQSSKNSGKIYEKHTKRFRNHSETLYILILLVQPIPLMLLILLIHYAGNLISNTAPPSFLAVSSP